MAERDAAGRFLPGNKTSNQGGRPSVRRSSKAILRTLREIVEANFDAMLLACVERVKTTGDTQGLAKILAYAVGLPPQTSINLDDDALLEQISELWKDRSAEQQGAEQQGAEQQGAEQQGREEETQ